MSLFHKISLECITFCLCLLLTTELHADTQRDFQSWLNFSITGHFDEKNKTLQPFRYWIEGQGRFGDDSHRLSQTLGGVGIGYTMKRNMSLWLGYVRVHTALPFTPNPIDEDRIIEQLLWQKKFKSMNMLSRTRLEQRFLSNGTQTAYRARQLIKLTRPLKRYPKFSIVGGDELFWHKNDFIGRNGQGFDQNRVFIGLGYQILPTLNTEVGYMNQYIRRFGVPNFLNNALFVNFFWSI